MAGLKKYNKQENILKFLKDRKCLNIKCIEIESKVPFTTISLALNGSRDLPEKSIDVIILTLKKYGFK